MEKHQLLYQNSFITYYYFGRGPRPVLCFHGYGEDGQSFEFLEGLAAEHYTFIAIDLPFHGATVWKDGLDFSVEDLLNIVEEVLPARLKISAPWLSLMGFSLGGRIALSLYQEKPAQIERVVLLAPDGLKVNGWYWFATQSWLGNKFFAYTMRHPAWFFGFLKMVNRLGFVNTSVFKFVNAYIGDKEFRNLLYSRWTTLRRLRPDLEKIKSFIREYQTRVRLVYGRHDRIIKSSVGKRFQKNIENECRLEILESGHQVLQKKHGREILRALED